MQFFNYQTEGIAFVEKARKVYLAFDMGMGKTITGIAGARSAAHRHVLLVAEKNEIVNSQNFRKEIEEHFGADLFYRSLRDEKVPGPGDVRFVCGINPEGLQKITDKELECFDAMIIDEATIAKTRTSIRFKAMLKIARKMNYVVMLSGTPMMNGAAELYAPLLLLGHPLAGDGTKAAQEAFERIFAGGFLKLIRKLPDGYEYKDLFGRLRRYAWKYTQWWAKGSNNVRELRWLIQDRFMFQRKADTGGIFKKKTRRIEWVEKSPEWQHEYATAWDQYLVTAAERKLNLDNITELRNLIENGQVYQVNSKWKARQAVADIMAGKYGDQRIIIFTMFIETDRILQEELAAAGISFKTFDDIAEWKTGTEQVLVGRIASHAKGGNAAEASLTLMIDMNFVPGNNLQAENRMDRPEQKNEMEVVYYMARGDDDVDAHVQSINKDKMRKIDEFMRPFTPEEAAEMPAKIRELVAKFPAEFRTLQAMAAPDPVPWE